MRKIPTADTKVESQGPIKDLLDLIVKKDASGVADILSRHPRLADESIAEERLYSSRISHWIYTGDTSLHLAAAGHRPEIVRLLLKAGADPNAARNRRRARPLHYAADAYLGNEEWDPELQVETIKLLLEAGASIDAQDRNGASALHRAVRTRSAAAAKFLLSAGADPTLRNKPGSTPFHLAVQNTGRGGSGETVAIEGQREIIETFLSAGISPQLRDGKGHTVLESARSAWIVEIFDSV
jgi:hypothetical protein